MAQTPTIPNPFVYGQILLPDSSLTSALRAYLKGNNAILEKRGSKVRYRERFMRVWMLLQVTRNPSMFPAARDLQSDAEYLLLLPYFADALA